MAGIMELPIEVRHSDHTERWRFVGRDFLNYFGLEMRYHYAKGPIWQDKYWIASVKSKNYKEVTHAVPIEGTKVTFDVSTAKRYRKVQRMLASDKIVCALFSPVHDLTRTHKL